MGGEIDEKFSDGRDDGTEITTWDRDDVLDQISCERDGFDLEELRAERVVRESIWREAPAYHGLAPEAWPGLTWNWDFSAKAQRYVYDGLPPPKFKAAHPNGLRLGWVLVEQFDTKLSHFNRRNGISELWALGDESKLAKAIAYARQGRPLTPPMVAPLPTEKADRATEVYLVGGNHRYTVAKFSGLIELPIYVEPELADAVAAIIPVRWEDPV